MERVAQGDFRHLQRAVERLAEGYIQEVAGKRRLVVRAVPAVSIQTLGIEMCFDCPEIVESMLDLCAK